MLAIPLILVAIAAVITFLCCFAVFLQEAFAGGAPQTQLRGSASAGERILDRAPMLGVGALQPTSAATFSI